MRGVQGLWAKSGPAPVGVEDGQVHGLHGRWRNTVRRIRARFPYYVDYVRDDPKWLLMFVSGRFVAVRRLQWRFGRCPPIELSSPTLFSEVDVDAVVRNLHEDGICSGIQVPERVVAEIRAFADTTTCFGNLDRNLPFMPADHREAEKIYERPILVGHFHDLIEQCPGIVAIRDDPILRAVACRYLRADAILINSRLWWSFPTANYDEAALSRASQERFHFDMNDWRSLKFFFYMTEVDDRSGPHVYVRGSHRRRPFRDQMTLFVGKTDDHIRRFYGETSIRRLHGPAGFGFAEDPFGFHMGTVAQNRNRLILEVEYGISRRPGPQGGRLFSEQRPATVIAACRTTPGVMGQASAREDIR